MIPTNYDDWKVCIEQKCGIPLTLEFAEKRLAVYDNETLAETQEFIRLYGQDHLQHIKQWFARVIASHDTTIN